MGKIGFNTKSVTEDQENDNVAETNQVETYSHKVKLFGIPVFTSTKNLVVDITTSEK